MTSVINPGFEEGLTGWTPEPNVSEEANIYSVLADPALAHTGNGVLCWNGEQLAAGYSPGLHTDCQSSEFTIPGGHAATVSAWVRVVRADISAFSGGGIYCRNYDAGGIMVEETGKTSVHTFQQTTDSGWQKITVELPHDPRISKRRVVTSAFGPPESQVYFDDIEITVGPKAGDGDGGGGPAPSPPTPAPATPQAAPSTPIVSRPASSGTSQMMPKPSEPIVDRAGHVTRSWRNYLAQLGGAQSLDELWSAVESIAQQAAGGDPARPAPQVLGVNSVQTLGDPEGGIVRVQLQGDEPLPSPRQVYGVREDLSRGFMSFADMVAVGDGLAKALDYGPYAFRGELGDPGALPGTVVVGDAYLIEGDLWVGADEGRPDDPQWENAGPASPSPVLSLDASLDQLNDVDAPTPVDGQALAWDAAGAAWKPKTVSTDRNVDGGRADSIYLPTQRINGGGA